MTLWATNSSGGRSWPAIPSSAIWRYDSSGTITASREGVPIHIGSMKIDKARSAVAKQGQLVFDVTHGDRQKMRAMFGLMLLECPWATLPCWGDCWKKDEKNRVGICGSDNVGPPHAVGFYQWEKIPAKQNGYDWDRMSHDAKYNHECTLDMLEKTAKKHGWDFPTIAVLWNAGSVRSDPSNQWGVKTYNPNTVTLYCQGWNAAGQAINEFSPSAGISSVDSISEIFPKKITFVEAAFAAFAIYRGFKLGRAIGL